MAITSTGKEQDFDYGIRNLASQPDPNPNYIVTQSNDGTQGIIESAFIQFEERTEVSDSNYDIIGENNRLVAFTAITTDRTVTLPEAMTPNQRIWITDESGLCSNVRRIIVVPFAGDVIGGDSFAVINFPNGSGYLESNGLGKWNIISTTSIQYSAGVNTMPSITDNGDGTVTVGTGVYSLFANVGGQGRPKAYQVTGGTFSLTDQSSNWIIATYNTTTGAVSVSSVSASTSINNITVIPIFKIFRDGVALHIGNYDTLGLALTNKIQRSFEKTEPYRFEAGGVLIGESATRIITISSGNIWSGGNEIPLTEVASNTHTCYQFVNTSGTWSKSVVTQYNNTQYNAVGGLVTLGNTNSYAVNYVFRSVGTDTDFAFVLGTGDYTLGQAQTAPIPSNLPTFITEHMVFVGRIIVQKNITTAAQIDSANTTGALFTTAGVTDHNALNNLQGGTATERYHLTLAQYNAAISPTLQNAYNNGTAGVDILTDATRLAWTIKRGSGADSDNLIEALSGTDQVVFQVNGNGRITTVADAVLNGSTFGRGGGSINVNTASGLNALSGNTTGINNTGSGSAALLSNATTSGNTGIGYATFASLNSGSGSNTAFGAQSGRFLADGTTGLLNATQSLYVGADTKASATGMTNEIAIGYGAIGKGSNTVTLGNSSIVTTFLRGQVSHRNAANTFDNFFTNATTASRTWTMPDATGTVALTSNPTAITATSFIASTGTVRLKGFTVATLPAGTVGDIAYVTDATAPTWGAVAVGGGAVTITVFYNGTNWITQ